MQGTGRRGAPSLFVTLPRTGLCTEPYSGPHARLCSGPHGSHLLPHHRHRPHRRPHHRRTAAPVSSASSPLTARRPHLRPPPVTSLPHSRPRRPPCLPLPSSFFPNFRCVFRTRHATNVCTFVQHAENKYVTFKAEKDNLLTESKLHFSGFPAGRHGATDP